MQCLPKTVVVRRPIEDEADRHHSRSSRRSSVVSTHSHSSNHGQPRPSSPRAAVSRRSSTGAPFDSPVSYRKRSSSPPPVHILPHDARGPLTQPATSPSSPSWSSPAQSVVSLSRSSSISSVFGAPLQSQSRFFSFNDDADSTVEPSPPSSGPSSPAFPGCSPPGSNSLSLFSSVASMGSRLQLPESQYSVGRAVPAIGPFPSVPSPVGPPSASRSFSSPLWPLTPSSAAALGPVTARSVSAPDWPSWSPWSESRTTGILSGLATPPVSHASQL